VSDSLISGNGTGLSAVNSATATFGIRVTRSSIVNNLTTGALSDVRWLASSNSFSDNLITGNSPGVSSVGGGLLFSYQNNGLNGDFPDEAFNKSRLLLTL
jgi:hypothetical protein